jgi:uracil-DNA glycosylase
MAESQEFDAVYLEDIETPSTQTNTQSTQSDQDGSSGEISLQGASGASEKATTVVNNKRKQRTLMDMFAGSQPTKVSGPVAKKLKLSASEPALPTRSGSTSVASSSKNLRLNAIPFSLAQYQESLSADQRSLLALECSCMGKSWCATEPTLMWITALNVSYRLKVLKDEIKKPYFIALKKFLWEEGALLHKPL